MSLPVAHGLLGASVVAAFYPSAGTRLRTLLLVGALLGICPDFDYALNWLHIAGGGWHHGFTHSILFALLLGFVAVVVVREQKVRGMLIFSGATVSHTLLDYLITRSRGVALWWPFTGQRYKLMLSNPVDYSWNNETLWEVAAGILRISLMELLLLSPVLLGILFIKQTLAQRRVLR